MRLLGQRTFQPPPNSLTPTGLFLHHSHHLSSFLLLRLLINTSKPQTFRAFSARWSTRTPPYCADGTASIFCAFSAWCLTRITSTEAYLTRTCHHVQAQHGAVSRDAKPLCDHSHRIAFPLPSRQVLSMNVPPKRGRARASGPLNSRYRDNVS
jgi:hypothetical protein